MSVPFFSPRSLLSRRAFLRGTGVAIALPALDAMQSVFAGTPEKPVRRMVAVQTNMGIMPQFFFPELSGQEYALTPYLEPLKDFKKQLTVFSGVSHPDVDGGHAAEVSFLTAAPHPGSGAFRNAISLDQFAAERIGSFTRFPSFVLYAGNELGGISYTRSGVRIPPERSPAALYKRMFVQGTPAEIEARCQDLRNGRSLLDFVGDSSKKLDKDLGPNDKDRLDQYFTSVRELETQLQRAEEWERRPKPKTAAPAPQDIKDDKQFIARIKLMFDMIRLAFESDSTRIVTLFINALGTHAIPGVQHETHSLTHHGNKPETIEELRRIEAAQFEALCTFLAGLAASKEGSATLLDRTAVLYGTCMGSANSHANTNLPVLLAGGGFRHAGHLAFDKTKNYPLPNLFVSILQRLGLEVGQFASSTGTMRGLELS
jgi:hypothetical protein